MAVHAGSFLRQRRIVLDATLKGREHTRILLHELFHFAWIRLSNSARLSYMDLLRGELDRHARGELGWSAEWRKASLTPTSPERRFREYVCESFCDSASWRYGTLQSHAEFTLAPRWAAKRRAWFDRTFPGSQVHI